MMRILARISITALAIAGSAIAASAGPTQLSLYGVEPGMSVQTFHEKMDAVGFIPKNSSNYSIARTHGQGQIEFLRTIVYQKGEHDSSVEVHAQAVGEGSDWIIGRLIRRENFAPNSADYSAIMEDAKSRFGLAGANCEARVWGSEYSGFLLDANDRPLEIPHSSDSYCIDPKLDETFQAELIQNSLENEWLAPRQIIFKARPLPQDQDKISSMEIDIIAYDVIGERFREVFNNFNALHPTPEPKTKLGKF